LSRPNGFIFFERQYFWAVKEASPDHAFQPSSNEGINFLKKHQRAKESTFLTNSHKVAKGDCFDW
jgi:hypothetical protein